MLLKPMAGLEARTCQSRMVDEEWINPVVARGDAASTGVEPAGPRGVDRVEGEVVVRQRMGSGVQAWLSAVRRDAA